MWSLKITNETGTQTYDASTLTVVAPATFSLNQTTFTYNGASQGPTIVASPSEATFTQGGTLRAIVPGNYTATAAATGNFTGSNSSLSWNITKADQSISFGNPGPRVYGFPVTLSASATSGLPVALSVISGPATISGNVVTATGAGNVTVRASQGGDSNYNAAADVDNTFVFANTAPTGVTLTLSGSALVSGAQGETALYLGDALTVSGTVHDSDGNLTVHNLSVSSDGAQTWTLLPGTDGAPTNRTDSSKSVSFRPNRTGRWDFNSNGTDGLVWPTGESKTLWVYGADNNAAIVDYTVNGISSPTTVSVARGQTFAVSITLRNTENRPWNGDATPHKLVTKLVGWGADTIALPAGTVYQGQTTTFTFNVTAPATVGTYAQQWQMAEYFGSSPTLFGSAVAVSFIVNSAPAVTITATPTSIAFGQSVTVSATATDADANLAFHGIIALNQAGNGWYRSPVTDHSTGWGNHPTSTDFVSASYTSGITSGGSSPRSVVHRPSWVGVLTYHSNAYDGYAWASPSGSITVPVSKATPIGTFVERTLTPGNSATYSVTAADLNAAFSNPYSTAVAPPTGIVSYSVVKCDSYPAEVSKQLSAGSTLVAGATYTIRASYPGDANYNTAVAEPIWTVAKGTQGVVACSGGTITFGDTFTAKGTGGSGTGAYQWELIDGGTAAAASIGSSSGVCSYSSVGTILFRVRRLGDAVWADSSWSAASTLTVLQQSVATTITVNPISAQFIGTETQSLSVSATVGGSTVPSAGSVTFTLRNAQGVAIASTTTPVSSGVVTGTIVIPSSTSLGTGYRVTASYVGGSSTNYSWTPSSSDSASFTLYPEPIVSQGLRAWYRTDFGITTDGSGRVSEWLDASGHAFDLQQGTAGRRPFWVDSALNNRPILNFENGERLLTGSIDLNNGSEDLTVTVVLDPAATQTTNAALLDQNAQGQKGFSFRQSGASANNYVFAWWDQPQTSLQGAVSPVVSTGTDWRVVTFIKSGTTQSVYLDGLEVSSAAVAARINKPVAQLVVGGSVAGTSDWFAGNVAEVQVFSRALDVFERMAVEEDIGLRLGLLDTDGDGLSDPWELAKFGSLAYNGFHDVDADGLTNAQEYLLGTDPTNPDTDGDGLRDGYEMAHNHNPLVADAPGVPGDFKLVLRLPNDIYAGVETTNWTLTGIANP